MKPFLYFHEAVIKLGCSPQWLTQQITRGLVRFTLESDQKGAHRYRLNRDDVKELMGTTPKFKPSARPTPRMTEAKVVFRSIKTSIEIQEEARSLGLTVEEYRREIGIR